MMSTMNGNINAVVIGADSVNTIGMIRSLGSAGVFPSVIILTKRNKAWVTSSRYTYDYTYLYCIYLLSS